MFDQINAIQIKDVVSKCWLEFKSIWAGEYNINSTDWRRFNENKNFVTDFSKDRGQGWPFDFVKSYYNFETKSVFERFESNFGVVDDGVKQEKKEKLPRIIDVTAERVKLLSPWIAQEKYLKSRGIDPTKIDCCKTFRNGIGCLINTNGAPVSIVWRDITGSKQRFTTLKGSSAQGVYSHKINPENETLYVVEGMFDFLTLRQYTTNVVWLRNWSSGIGEVVRLSQHHKIVFIPDADEAGANSVEQLKEHIDFYLFDLSKFGAKDINELYNNENLGDDLTFVIDWSLDYIMDGNIAEAFNTLGVYQDRYQKYGKLWIDWPFPQIDEITQGMIPWKVYTIWAYSNTGKSKLSYFYTQHFLKAWKSVMYVSLEVDKGMVLANIISTTERVWFHTIMKEWYRADKTKYKKLKIYDNVYNLNELEELITKSKPDVFVLDFIQNVQTWEGNMYQKTANVAQGIQRMTIKANCITISLSQVDNKTGEALSKWNAEFVKLKGAGELFASSDVILILYRVDDELFLKVEKNKYWKRGDEYAVDVERVTWQFSLSKTDIF